MGNKRKMFMSLVFIFCMVMVCYQYYMSFVNESDNLNQLIFWGILALVNGQNVDRQ
jgi:hypothetical protein